MSKKMANIKNFKFKDYNIIGKKEGKVYAFLAKYKGRNIVYKTTDATLYEDVDGNERRSHSARAFIYEKIKSIYYGNINSDIEVGATYECIKEVKKDADEMTYAQGQKYRSDQSGCITDIKGCVDHYWDSKEEFDEHFKRVNNG